MESPHPVDKLLSGGEAAMLSAEPELALKFFQRALVQQPDNPRALDGAAEALLALGNGDGNAALGSYTTAIELLRGSVSGAPEPQVVRKQLCSAHVSVAELYMTDLCMENGAEEACERNLREAQEFDEGAPELPQAQASLRLSQNRQQEAAHLALEAARRTEKLMRDAQEAATALGALSVGDKETVELPTGPELELRISLTKILIECASQEVIEEGGHGGLCGKCAEQAAEVIHSCLQEDEDNVEQWFLLGCATQLMAPPDVDVARDAFDRAQQMLAKIREAYQQMGEEFPYEEQMASILRQQALLGDTKDAERCDTMDEEAEQGPREAESRAS